MSLAEAMKSYRLKSGRLPDLWRTICPPHLLIACLCLLPVALRGQENRPTETQVEAAYLFNFGKFVRWPANSASNSEYLVICVLGNNMLGMVLEGTVKGETIDNRTVVAKALPNLQATANCNVMFVNASEEAHLDAILSAVRHQGILTVSDIPHFTDRGGMIEFVHQQDRIRFKVNLLPMADVGISVSSELLKVATKVIGQSGGAK
jgi:hypothetical protein